MVEITTPRTSDPASFALSPDGRRLAFVADHDGQPMLWVRELDSAERARPAGHGRRAPAVLVAGQPLDRVLHEQRAETHRGPRRCAANRHLSSGRDDGDVGTGRNHPVLQHRLALAAPRQCRGRERGGGDDANGGVDRPSPSAVPARRPAVPVLRRRSGRRARRVSGLARIVGGDASRGVRHAGRVRRARLAAVRPPGNALGAALRSRTTNDERRADRRRGLGRVRAHRRHRCVFDVGRGRAGLSGGASVGDTAVVVRPVRQSARHDWTFRADWAHESPAVAGWPSRGRRTLAPERNRRVAARFHAPDALHAGV